MGNRVAKSNELVDLLVDVGESGVEKIADVLTGGLTAVSNKQNLTDLGECEPRGLTSVDEVDPGDGVGRIVPVTGGRAVGFGEQLLLLVEAQGRAGGADSVGQLYDPHRPYYLSFDSGLDLHLYWKVHSGADERIFQAIQERHVRQIVRIVTDKVGVVGTVVATMACAMCFPAVGAIGAVIGLGFLSQWEDLFIDVLPVFAALVLVANGLGWFAHRQWRRSALGIIGPILVLIGWVSFMSEVAAHGPARVVLQTGLVVMVVFAVWDLVSPSSRRCGPEGRELPAKHG